MLHRKFLHGFAAAIGLAVAFQGTLASASTSTSASATNATANEGQIRERVFAKIHAVNTTEIALSQLVFTRSKTALVTDMATLMIDDHTKGDRDLLAYALQTRTPIEPFMPQTPSETRDQFIDQSAMRRLSTMHGNYFDNDFIDTNIDGHIKVYNWLNDRLPYLSAADQSFVRRVMVVVYRHYEMLLKIHDEIPK